MSIIGDAFNKLKSNLEITKTEETAAMTRHTNIRDYIRTKWDLDDDFLTGSYRRRTKTKPLKDVDMFVVIDPTGDQGYLRNEEPQKVLNELHKVLEVKWPNAYIDGMVTRRRDALTDDLLSDLIRAEVDGDRLTHDELLMLAGGILMAGTDTTRNQLAAAVQVLCDHPDQWALLAEHPELAPNAVEELMRYSPIIFSTMRVAVEDVELAGFTIPAGTLVIANTAAANRDPAVYDEPDRLDITREDPQAMLTFGGGIHYCLGTHLARVELVEALTTITRRMPHPRRVGAAPWRPMTGITGPVTLPIEFDAGH